LVALVVSAAVTAAAGREEKAISCEKCGEIITGSYFETNGAFFHADCFLCGHCGAPIQGTYTTYREGNYHPDCFEDHVAKRCTLCDGIIQSEYLLDFWGNAYHISHQLETQTCEYCGRLIAPHTTRGGVHYSDGRYICNSCRDTAVTDKNDAMLVMSEVARHMRRFGMDVDIGDLELHVVGLKKMQQLSGRGSSRLTGFTDFEETKSLFGLVSKRRVDVYLLYGMPRIDVVSTLSHELAHVWQFSAGRLDNDEAFSEGSCNYASFLVLQNYNSRASDYVVANLVDDDNRIYGRGFRRVKTYADAEGIDAWLDRLSSRDRLPREY
jgi:hypothetical protein